MSTIVISNIKATGETASRAVSGVAAAWVNFDGTGTIAVRDSQGVSGLVDDGAGNYRVNLTNAMGNANYSAVANTGSNDVFGSIIGGSQATTLLRVASHYYGSSANLDRDHVYAMAAGDLA